MAPAYSASLLNPPLTPRDGRVIKVLGIARISGENQDELSLDDQAALYRRLLDLQGVAYELDMVSGRGSGEHLDRKESDQARSAVETRRYDLVIAEDLGRIYRRVHSQIFCELCEDVGTRLIAINDHIDTALGNWRVMAGFATMRHEMYNEDTSRRIKRTLRNRFAQGGVIQCLPYGVIKPPGAKHSSELRKDPDAEPVVEEVFALLEKGASFGEAADWLNENRTPMGLYARSSRWTGPMVAAFVRNPILKGVRVRNRKVTRRENATGKRKSIAAPPSELLTDDCPQLVFVQPERYDALMRKLDADNAHYRRKGCDGGTDPRKGVPKKRTRWPGQHLHCGVCGRLMCYGGHGQKDRLLCSGAYKYQCWNAVTVDGPAAAAKLIDAVHRAVESLLGYDTELMTRVEEELRVADGGRAVRVAERRRRREQLAREAGNLTAAIRAAGVSPILLAELRRIEDELAGFCTFRE